MNELSNHDHSRFLTRTNKRVGRVQYVGPEAANEGIQKGIFKEAVVMQMTWPGAPTVYYGDEAGVCGWTDPDNRRSYPWGKEDKELIDFHKEMIRIHKQSKALRIGSLHLLHGEYGIITYGRTVEEEKYVIAINNLEEEREVLIPVWKAGIQNEEPMLRLMETTREGYSIEPVSYAVCSGTLRLKLQPVSGVVLKTKNG